MWRYIAMLPAFYDGLVKKLVSKVDRFPVDTGLVQSTTPADTQPVSIEVLPLATGAATSTNQTTEIARLTSILTQLDVALSTRNAEITQLSVLSQLAVAITKLEDIFGAVDGLELTADNIAINADAIDLNTDQVELYLTQIRDRLPSIIGQLNTASSLSVALSLEQELILTGISTKLSTIITNTTGLATDTTLQATNASLGTDGAAPPSIPGTGVRGWLRSIYEFLIDGIDLGEREALPVSMQITASGDTTVLTPGIGLRVRLLRIQALNKPTAVTSPLITIKLGAVSVFSNYAVALRQRIVGPIDGALVVNLSEAGEVAFTYIAEQI